MSTESDEFINRLIGDAKSGDVGSAKELVHEFLNALQYSSDIPRPLRDYFCEALATALESDKIVKSLPRALNLVGPTNRPRGQRDKFKRQMAAFYALRKRSTPSDDDVLVEMGEYFNVKDDDTLWDAIDNFNFFSDWSDDEIRRYLGWAEADL